jgi:D-tyrosyl-tRNA(Tyr) deacylase
MRAVVQRVSAATVRVDGVVQGAIGLGLLVYLGVAKGDDEGDARALAAKIPALRLFEDEAGKLHRSVVDVGGALLVVSQFTLFGDVRRGRRPSFDGAMEPEAAERLYQHFAAEARRLVPVETGVFRATMQVASCNEGPVTLLLDTREAAAP